MLITLLHGVLMCCPFCRLEPHRIILDAPSAVAILDGFPVSPGHMLIIPKRHIASWFDTTEEEQRDLSCLLQRARMYLMDQYAPQGFNIGINDGVAAGQTVMHLHIHLIPRYSGDQADPRGGVRLIFPDKANYWE